MSLATQQPKSKPKYLQLVEEVRRQVESGALQSGDRLPSYAELRARYSTTQATVDRAHALLEQDGLIERIQGRGTFVADRVADWQQVPSSDTAGMLSESRTVVALVGVAEPDRAIFDRAVSLLFGHVAAADLSLACQLANPDSGALPLPQTASERPVGYVVFGRRLLPLAKRLQDAGQRVVAVGTPFADRTPEVPVVQGDQAQGGYVATRHLLELGHRRIAFRGWSDWPQMQRYRGHQRALAEARQSGVEIEDSEIFEGQYEQWRHAPATAEAYFRRPGAPTGIVVWNDHIAVALLTLLSYIGIRVPQDVSLVGYDNVPEGQQVHPPLTTVESALEQQLQAAVKLLTQPVPPSPLQTVIVLPHLIRRDSSAPAAR